MDTVAAMAGALDGIRVLDVSIIVQGPQAAALLHDLGAEVIKIELPGVGDLARLIPCGPDDRRAPLFIACNRGKRSAMLDLRSEGGRRAFLKLVQGADIVVSNFQPGTLERWRLGFEELRAVNPEIILAAGSALGPVGPDAQREGADGVAQAAGGLISTTGVDGGEVTMIGAAIADHIGSLNMVVAVLAALHHRTSTGQGQQVDVSLLGGQIWAQASEYTHFLLTGKSCGRANRGHPLVKTLYRMFATADGEIVLVGVPPPQWPAFCAAIERNEWADDPRFAVFSPSPENVEVLIKHLADVLPHPHHSGMERTSQTHGCPVQCREQLRRRRRRPSGVGQRLSHHCSRRRRQLCACGRQSHPVLGLTHANLRDRARTRPTHRGGAARGRLQLGRHRRTA